LDSSTVSKELRRHVMNIDRLSINGPSPTRSDQRPRVAITSATALALWRDGPGGADGG